MERAAKRNGRPIHPTDRELIQNSMCQLKSGDDDDETQSNPSLLDLLANPGMRRNFLILCYVWFSYNLGYYGLVYNTPAFGWNIFLVFVFPVFFTLPMVILSPWIENKLGRKFVITVSLFVAGLVTLATAAVPEGEHGLNSRIF